jgi:hypothetical protein
MGLSALVQTKLEQSPMSGHVFVFRGRRGDLIKLLARLELFSTLSIEPFEVLVAIAVCI